MALTQKLLFTQDYSEYPITFNYLSNEIARIDREGIFHFCVEPSDENTKKFVDLLQNLFNRKITGLNVVEKKSKNLFTNTDNNTYSSDDNSDVVEEFDLLK
jgi:hypothetical protein